MSRSRLSRASLASLALVLLLRAVSAAAATGGAVRARADADLATGRPLVVHVVVALCDNESQGIVPVPARLGDGQAPGDNLYWGALHGVRTHLPRAGWERLTVQKSRDPRVLERAAFFARVPRGGVEAPVFVVADAWDGAEIRSALRSFLDMTAGRGSESVRVERAGTDVPLQAGGAAHVVAYVGHDGLMDFSLNAPARATANGGPRSAIVLACASRTYFADHLDGAGAHALLLTTGLMAPEAYTLDAAIRAWASGASTDGVVEAAALSYHRYQQCGRGAARRLFWGAP